MTDTSSRYVNTFIYHLCKNKMAYPFARQVTSSLDRRGFRSNRCWQKSSRKELQSGSKSLNKRVSQAQPSSRDKRTESFRIKEGVLGESIRVIDSPRKTQGRTVYDSVKLGDLSPLKASTRNHFRSQSRDKNVLKFNSLILNQKQLMLQEALTRRSSMLELNRLDLILSTLTGNPNVANLRIYKETLKKFYICRYSKEKITSFFDYEYIEDYDSQLKILETLLSFKLQQIYYLCFLVLDQNSDGLLCNNDLFLMATVTSKENPLINKDIFKIFQYVTYYRNLKPSIPIMDSVSDEEEFKSENTNLQRYRLMETKKEKDKEKSRRMLAESLKMGSNIRKTLIIEPNLAKNGKKTILTRKTNKHLFSYHKEEDGEAAIKQLRKKFAQTPLESKSNLTFKVNFNTFKTIFRNQIPETYYDLLYAIGGVELPEKSYLPLNFSIYEPQIKEIAEVALDRYGHFRDQVTQMRQTFRRSRIQRFLTESQSLKSLYL